MPQALRRLLPPIVGLLVNIIQNTTIVQVIGAAELLESAKRQVERLTAPPPAGIAEIHSFEIYGAVMVIFFLISFPLTRLAAYLGAPARMSARGYPVLTAVAVAQLVEPRVHRGGTTWFPREPPPSSRAHGISAPRYGRVSRPSASSIVRRTDGLPERWSRVGTAILFPPRWR